VIATYLEDDHDDGVLKPHEKNMKTKTWETLMELCSCIEQDEHENMRRWEDNEITPWKTWEDGQNSLKGSKCTIQRTSCPKNEIKSLTLTLIRTETLGKNIKTHWYKGLFKIFQPN
jgi:hypothetical protein